MKIKGSYIWAILITAIVGGWLYSGELIIGGQSNSGDNSDDATADTPVEQPLVQVRVTPFQSELRTTLLAIRGRTQTDARVSVKAETGGLVEEIPVARGDRVTAGQLVCRIEPGARNANVLEANARVEQAELDHEAVAKLVELGHTAETRLRASKAELDAAQAALTRAELDLARTELHAPFAGIVEHENAEIGDFLNVGSTCVTIISLDPMLVVGQVSERVVASLSEGMDGNIKLITGEEIPGQISFISPSADSQTRTFRVELEIDNPDYSIRDNVTADIEIEMTPRLAHRFTAAILSLDDTGRIGVKAVGLDNVVQFMPITILADTREGVWVAGLPKNVTLVTVGQEYVVDGQEIVPIQDASAQNSGSNGQ